MTDIIQQQIQLFATQSTLARDLVVFCADMLIFVVAAAWLVALLTNFPRLTASWIVRVAIMAVLAIVVAKVSGLLISDTRPYILGHFTPLAPVSHDNGFPSDHVLLAAVLTASLWWIERRFIPFFAAATLLIMVGRLGIGAHHTLDVVGSVVIALIAALIAGALHLPESWNRPITALVRREPVHRPSE